MATVIEQRGRTAVLGASHEARPYIKDNSSSSSSSQQIASSSKLDQPVFRPRGVARRKLQRRENARLTSNPHVVRPSLMDYSLLHNERKSTMPLPEEQDMPSRLSMTLDNDDRRSAEHGVFTMSYSDARWFLSHRLRFSTAKDGNAVGGPVQRFAKQVEAELKAWLSQEVFLYDHQQMRRPVRITTLDRGESIEEVWEVVRNDRNLVWIISDPFLRLTVHCLARMYGCASFSKSTHDGVRQTWILQNVVKKNLQSQKRCQSLDTPPVTDTGTDADAGMSDLASTLDAESDDALSEAGQDDRHPTRIQRAADFDRPLPSTEPIAEQDDDGAAEEEEDDLAAFADVE